MDTKTIASDAANILLAVVPALSPYGVALDIAFEAVATVAPAIYEEVKNMIASIKSGSEPTAEEIARLRALTAALKQPDGYFTQPEPKLMNTFTQPEPKLMNTFLPDGTNVLTAA